MPNDNRFAFITSEDYVVYDDEPVSPESVEDLCAEYNNLWSYELLPPRDRDAFMEWYFAARLERVSGLNTNEMVSLVQDAENAWRFVNGEFDTATRDQILNRMYINAMERRKGNAVVAFTIRC